jgi:hypothetical protein
MTGRLVSHSAVTIRHFAKLARELNRKLHWDPAEERFITDHEANRLDDRARRRGFELPA